MFDLTVLKSTRVGSRAVRLTLARPDRQPLVYAAGQFINLHFELQGHAVERSYSIASPPAPDSCVQIVIIARDGAASRHLSGLTDGDRVRASGPHGRFFLSTDERVRRYVLVCTGTGIAPYHAMMPTLESRLGRGVRVIVLYGVRRPTEALFLETLIAMAARHRGFEFRICCSAGRCSEPWMHDGYVQHHFDDLDLDPVSDLAYLCGNAGMIAESLTILERHDFHRFASLSMPGAHVLGAGRKTPLSADAVFPSRSQKDPGPVRRHEAFSSASS